MPFFGVNGLQAARFKNRQYFDFEGLSGRLLSSSYIPVAGHPNYMPMMEELRAIFDATQEYGTVCIEYETEVFWGEIS